MYYVFVINKCYPEVDSLVFEYPDDVICLSIEHGTDFICSTIFSYLLLILSSVIHIKIHFPLIGKYQRRLLKKCQRKGTLICTDFYWFLILIKIMFVILELVYNIIQPILYDNLIFIQTFTVCNQHMLCHTEMSLILKNGS